MLTRSRLSAPYRDGCLKPAHLRHRHVHEDHARVHVAKGLERQPAVADDLETVVGFAQNLAEHQLVHLIVFGDQYVDAMIFAVSGTAAPSDGRSRRGRIVRGSVQNPDRGPGI